MLSSIRSISYQDYNLSNDKSLIDIKTIHQYLSEDSYWSKGIGLEKVKKSIQFSLCFGVYIKQEQIGFARVISDFSTIAYLGDVFILEAHRGLGLSKALMEFVMNEPDLQHLRRWILLTSDAHELYKQFGWQNIGSPDKWMEIYNPDFYKFD
jgi:GNAT superfamily N-acetyltransferase